MPIRYAVAFSAALSVTPAQFPAGSPQHDLLDSINAFRASFHDTAVARGPAAMALLDQRKLDGLLKDAEAQGRKGDVRRATALLEDAYEITERALIRLRENETVVYERGFRTPADEYRYERDLTRSYEQLLAKALAEAGSGAPPEAATLAGEARSRQARAEDQARRGDFAAATRTAELASEAMLQALQHFGLMAAR